MFVWGKFSLNLLFTKMCRGRHDDMGAGFTTTHTISAYHHYSCARFQIID